MNFWTSMSIGSNICITCITFTYASFCKIFAKQTISICTIIWLHLHPQYHAGANPCITSIYITSTYICICIIMKDTCITSTYICICILMKDTCITRSFHLHHHMAAFMSAYPIRIFALDIPWINIYIYICIHMKDICIIRFSFAPSQGCDHVCISNKDFASSIAGAYHFEVSIFFYLFKVLTFFHHLRF